MDLNPEQLDVVMNADGPALVVAGPGSGKTRILTRRIAHLIADHGIAPKHCLAITFTRRAAAEMRERLARLLPERAEAVPIHTFHSLGLALLREHTSAAGLRHGFRIADEADRLALLTDTLGVTPHRAERVLRAISMEKRTGRRAGAEVAEDFRDRAQDHRGRGKHEKRPARVERLVGERGHVRPARVTGHERAQQREQDDREVQRHGWRSRSAQRRSTSETSERKR